VERVLLVGLGGAVGSVLRYLVATAALRWLGPDYPWGTLAVNLAGAFAIGVVQELALDRAVVPEDLRIFLATGVMGGFTTYSAFSYETVRLAQTGAWSAAGFNVVVTTALCLVLCAAGMFVGRLLLVPRP
jgi:CrcB protein